MKVGWESYGTLNQDKSNVVLITHYFSGNSHAAGRYSPDDPEPGYWDAIIGPGKAIDTNTYFVIAVDSLVNAGVHIPHVVTTGPSSVNPDTGKPYGLDFPVVTIRDFVNVQKLLLESLGIERLHAVIGASMGSIQALEWAVAYPEWVERMVSVIGMGESNAWTTLALEQWALPIRLDPAWKNGRYAQDAPPIDGLTHSLMLITQQALFTDSVARLNPEHHPLQSGPLMDIRQRHSVVNWLEQRARERASVVDANHMLYLIRACQLFIAGHGTSLEQGLAKVKAKSLFLPATTDLLLLPAFARKTHEALLAQSKRSDYAEIEGEFGHLDGVYTIQQHAETLSGFLSSK